MCTCKILPASVIAPTPLEPVAVIGFAGPKIIRRIPMNWHHSNYTGYSPEFGAHIRNRTSLVPAMTSQVNGTMEIVDVAATPYRYHCLWVEALLLKEAYP